MPDEIVHKEVIEHVTHAPDETGEGETRGEIVEELHNEIVEKVAQETSEQVAAAAEVAVALAHGQAALATQQAAEVISENKTELEQIKEELVWTKTAVENLVNSQAEILSQLESLKQSQSMPLTPPVSEVTEIVQAPETLAEIPSDQPNVADVSPEVKIQRLRIKTV